MKRVKKIITHPGQAHRDEVFAIGLILWYLQDLGRHLPIERREPTPAELADPEVCVVDVGGQHDNILNNYDHHQFVRGTVSCALWLVAQALGFHDLLMEYTQWYEFTAHLDSLGPGGAAKFLGCEKFPFASMSPYEADMLDEFEKNPNKVIAGVVEVMGREVDKALKLKADFVDYLQKCTVGYLPGKEWVLMGDFVPSPAAMSRVRRHYQADGVTQVVASITRDDRGPGWCLYRYDDSKKVDFGKLAGHPKVTFAHASGFIAKTIDMPQAEVWELASGAWIS